MKASPLSSCNTAACAHSRAHTLGAPASTTLTIAARPCARGFLWLSCMRVTAWTACVVRAPGACGVCALFVRLCSFWTCLCMHVCVYACMYACLYICLYSRVCVRASACVFCMCTCVCFPKQAPLGFLRVLRVYRLARKVHKQTVVDVKNAFAPTLERGAGRQIIAIVATLLAYTFFSAGVVFTIEVGVGCSLCVARMVRAWPCTERVGLGERVLCCIS
jgi:hypothetical protein